MIKSAVEYSDIPEYVVIHLQALILDGVLKEPFSVKELRDSCTKSYNDKINQCTVFTVKYEELYNQKYNSY